MKQLLLLLACISASVTSFALNPSREYKVTPDQYGMDYKEIQIPTVDNMQLNAWIFKPSSDSRKYIIMSGNGDGNMADNLEIAAQFLSGGYNVIMYDYRGYGKSSDFKILPDMYIYPQFVKDLMGVCDYTRKFCNTQFDLYGIGIGAGLSLSVGAERTEVRRIIADAPYSDLEGMKNRIKQVESKDVMMPLAYDKMFIEPKYALEKGEQLYGILYIIGEKGQLVTTKDIAGLKEIHPKGVTIYVVPGVDNDKNFSSNKDQYFDQIKKFLAIQQ